MWLMRPHTRLRPPVLRPSTVSHARPPASIPLVPQQLRLRSDSTAPPPTYFQSRLSRFRRFENPSEEIRDVKTRNPLNYLEYDRLLFRRNQQLKKRMLTAGIGLVVCLAIQGYVVWNFYEPAPATEKGSIIEEKLDAPPGASQETEGKAVTVVQKPGNPDVMLDPQGYELIPTGTSSIPHFPKTIKVFASDADPAATATSEYPGQGAEEGEEEYSLIGLGIRKVSFLRVQVYVVGLYVRTTDLDRLQAAFVKHVNPLGSSLIPSEKVELRKSLMDGEASLEIWNKVLQEVRMRSAVRIVPTRGTDFSHLRDGWVKGITDRTQEALKAENKEYDDEGFGAAMQDFKALLGGKGKAPKGSVVLLTRDEYGGLTLLFEPVKKADGEQVKRLASERLGRMVDERISRQVWLGYLGGKNVATEDARRSIVDGVMELVERPVGTVGNQVS